MVEHKARWPNKPLELRRKQPRAAQLRPLEASEMKPWRRLSSRTIVQDRWISLRADRCQLPNGAVLDPYYVVEEREWVHMFAQDAEGKILVVRQYRYAADADGVELPGGVVDEDESPMEAARREFEEETGYVASEMVKIGSVFANPARQTNRIHVFAAHGLTRASAQRLDESEDISFDYATPDSIKKMIANGECSQALHISSFFLGLETNSEVTRGGL
jgi:8-oxo-dGTP pyrophosphatase MutT (NUDIX family)